MIESCALCTEGRAKGCGADAGGSGWRLARAVTPCSTYATLRAAEEAEKRRERPPFCALLLGFWRAKYTRKKITRNIVYRIRTHAIIYMN